ncbi:MAG: ribose 5-phosphate isomerase B [bacterium]
MKISVACDHAGLETKERVKQILTAQGHEVVDCGTNSKESCDYPDYGLRAARMVISGEVDRAVLVCWTGNGMGIAANKVRGVRAGIALNRDMAYYTRSHNDANVLVIGQKYVEAAEMEQILLTFLTTAFEGGRHVPRLAKIAAAEEEC